MEHTAFHIKSVEQKVWVCADMKYKPSHSSSSVSDGKYSLPSLSS